MILRSLSVAGLLATLPTVSIAQPAEPAPAPANPTNLGSLLTGANDDTLDSLSLPDAPLESILSTLEELTGRTIIRPAALPVANYSLVIKRPIKRSEAILALETVLNMNQIGLAPLGTKFLKVVPLPNLRTEAPAFLEGSALDLAPSGMVMAKVFQLNFLRVNEFTPQLTNLLNPQLGGPVIFEKTNSVLITDSISTLQRIERLVRELDQPLTASLIPKFYTLRFAKASTLVNQMRSILQGVIQNQLGAATTYSADDRTNQIVLIADARQHAFFDDLISKLDVKADPNTRNEVIYLKHATAKDVATLLNQIVSGQNQAASKSGQQSIRPGQGVNQTADTTAAPNPAPATPATPTVSAAAISNALENTAEFSNIITITADERSNAVVVSGTVDDIRLISDLIRRVDVLLDQVRIEVVIAEVTLSDSDQSGISALNLTVGQTSSGATSITNFSGAVTGWTVTDGVVNPLAFKAAMGDAGSRSNVKVLSAPTIVTTHNKEAQIIVGESRPIITGSQSTVTGTSTTPVTSSTVSYKDIAIDLKVTPLIGNDGSIQLKIEQKVDDLVGEVTVDNNKQPIIGRRQANSFINVKDGQMIVLGGLQRSKNTATRTKLGLFGEIPVISHIFGARSKAIERTELLLFIRPHVLPPEEGSKDASESVSRLSNRDQVNEYINPTPEADKKVKKDGPKTGPR